MEKSTKIIIAAGIITGILAAFAVTKIPQESQQQGYMDTVGDRCCVEYIKFEPIEIKANVQYLDFSDEEPMEIIGTSPNKEE